VSVYTTPLIITQLALTAVKSSMVDIECSVTDLQNAAHDATHALKTISDVQKAAAITAMAVGLGFAVFSPTPRLNCRGRKYVSAIRQSGPAEATLRRSNHRQQILGMKATRLSQICCAISSSQLCHLKFEIPGVSLPFPISNLVLLFPISNLAFQI
jgi:hypothetical protein